jgi:putative hydrolase of HD superfamily
MNSTQARNMVSFLRVVNKLKHLKRTGWVNSQVNDPETVASHMWRMGVMSILIPSTASIDRERCIKMCIVHDLAESIVGDITPDDNVADHDKHQLEANAIEKFRSILKQDLSDSEEHDQEFTTVVDEMVNLFYEYEENSTPEAKLVKDFDKFDMILQADEYERDQQKLLPSFFRTTQGRFQTDIGKNLVAELYKQRETK